MHLKRDSTEIPNLRQFQKFWNDLNLEFSRILFRTFESLKIIIWGKSGQTFLAANDPCDDLDSFLPPEIAGVETITSKMRPTYRTSKNVTFKLR